MKYMILLSNINSSFVTIQEIDNDFSFDELAKQQFNDFNDILIEISDTPVLENIIYKNLACYDINGYLTDMKPEFINSIYIEEDII